jgi:hypothetical protein
MMPPGVVLAVRRSRPHKTGLLVCAVVLAIAPNPTNAQTPAAAVAPSTDNRQPPITTFHVYTNLEQIPVLVLNADHQRMKPIDTSRFRVRIDSGPLFVPKYVRQEGDDPISLAILIDATRQKNELIPQLTQSISELAPGYLHSHDLVAVYRFDCNLIRTLYFKPADPAVLKDAVDRALESWHSGGEKQASGGSCKPSMPLWDSMAKTLADLSHQPGRHVLLVVSDGQDTGSKTPWTQVMRSAQTDSAAVFALTNLSLQIFKSEEDNRPGRVVIRPQVTWNWKLLQDPENKLDLICELSGGLEIQAEQRFEAFRLKEFAQMLRERYILEYPRGKDRKAGINGLEVSLGRDDLYIRPSGVSAPVASEDEIKGLNTAPADPTSTPTVGPRRALSIPQ